MLSPSVVPSDAVCVSMTKEVNLKQFLYLIWFELTARQPQRSARLAEEVKNAGH